MKFKRHLATDFMKKLMSHLILPHFDYINSLFVGHPDETFTPLQQLQNTATKGATNAIHRLPILQRCVHKFLVITYKPLNGLASTYLLESLTKKSYPRNTRASIQHAGSLVVSLNNRQTLADRGVSTLSPKHWNELPVSIKTYSLEY